VIKSNLWPTFTEEWRSAMDFNLQEECQGLVEVGSYSIPGEIDVPSLDPGSIDSTLEGEYSVYVQGLARVADNVCLERRDRGAGKLV
jgi:hypothetical protein